ncbi:hypothetical protein TSAR_004974 [Trichomalopsis sarcophagae]|uniref:DDE Tnp4 domain-containing protein n=1 Tax=Trichomalopsis sarcophagae TaxID=543379 RepID=A0A232EED9_9HYME|nr:hypothetical protein TSAR_004974 [Trichomalopsis sarcophagae]
MVRIGHLEANVNGFGNIPINVEKQLLIALWILGTPDSYRSITSKFGVVNATAWSCTYKVVRALCNYRNYFIRWPSHAEAQEIFARIEQRFGFPGVIDALDGNAYINRKGKHSIQLQVICNDRLEFIHCYAAWSCTYKVVRALCNYRYYFIRWPSHAEAQEISARIEQRFGFPGIIGALDGTQINIAAPKRDSNAYINRKGKHSIQLQVICNDRLEFIHCYTDTLGYRTNATIIFFPNDSHLLADAAYTLQNNIMVPYRDDGLFNTVLSRSRMMIERAIGLLKNRWRYFLKKIPMPRTDLIPFYILAICILHNICLKRDDAFEYPVIIPDANDFPDPEEVDDQSRRNGIIKRKHINIANQDRVNN